MLLFAHSLTGVEEETIKFMIHNLLYSQFTLFGIIWFLCWLCLIHSHISLMIFQQMVNLILIIFSIHSFSKWMKKKHILHIFVSLSLSLSRLFICFVADGASANAASFYLLFANAFSFHFSFEWKEKWKEIIINMAIFVYRFVSSKSFKLNRMWFISHIAILHITFIAFLFFSCAIPFPFHLLLYDANYCSA